MTLQSSAPERDSLSAVEELETAFARIGQAVKHHVRDLACAVHPELRQAGWLVMGLALRGAAEGKPVTVGEIVAATGMDKSVVSRQLRALADWGLVTTHRSEADARVVVVEPTEEAKLRFDAVRQRQRAIYAAALSEWSVEDAQRLGDLLTRLAESVTLNDD